MDGATGPADARDGRRRLHQDRRNLGAGPQAVQSELVRVRGLVQGVGFRPAVWRLAQCYGLRGWVGNDGAGVIMSIQGGADAIAGFLVELRTAPPPLARIEAIEVTPGASLPLCDDFRIVASSGGAVRTGVVPDAAICPACRAEIRDTAARRHGYPFANCTQCGPRLSIITAIPYDRANTTMRAFPMCAACAAEYSDPADRRFHAQPIACPACGPRVWLHPEAPGDALAAARDLLLAGRILAVKALGGFHLACDATNADAVARLRRAKRRDAKAFALMGRDLDVIRRFAVVTEAAAAALESPAAPVVVLDSVAPGALPGVAPGLATLGFMLPSTPLHDLLLEGVDRPVVMTSGNLADEPPCIANDEALQRLQHVAEHFLLHDREIARRVDDSVVQVTGGAVRVLRRARGHAPAPLSLPGGFGAAAPVLAMGGELKGAFCLLQNDAAILSPHLGDLEDAATFAEYRRAIAEYCDLFDHAPRAIAVDAHPDYLSSKLGADLAAPGALPIIAVQHHHAHLAACMAENGVRLEAGPMFGVVLDGLGWGSDGTIWGGEFLHADYRGFRRLACLKPVPMPGGAQAIREPWRNALAHLLGVMTWADFAASYGGTDLARYLAAKPVRTIEAMIARGVNAPLASSCGRLFDAVAAATGLCRDRVLYEGQAAMLLEAAAGGATVSEQEAYPFAIVPAAVLHIDPAPMWRGLLDDLAAAVPPACIAAKFHTGLAIAIVHMIGLLRVDGPVALSGGVFQNRLLLEQVMQRLAAAGRTVLTHRMVPANDGGLALGQAAVAAARLLCGDDGD
jgi:hydrogenase maturation protein HypF